MNLDNLALFLKIVEKGGLAAAGREVGLSPTSVSQRLAALETHFGATLLNRTTRSVSLTEEGRVLAEGAGRLIAEASDLDARVRLGMEQVSGPVRLSVPVDLGRSRIAPLIDTFLGEHPHVSVDLELSDGYSDLPRHGIDLAIRYGALADSGLRVRKLADNRRLVCASPAYLARHGAPADPGALIDHNCILMRFGQALDNHWRFRIDGRAVSVVVSGNRIANDGGLVREWCRAGHGIALKAHCDVRDDLQSGALVALFEAHLGEEARLQVVYPGGKAVPRRVRLLIDHLVAGFAS
ncbi:LysR family transcriptional regulator [Stappia stellulata]|uniref:LysR family transcriptional regulator n=1 Tax=Stappia stellulata TaxID=71235 RepID=UPI0004129EDA|nr:LysR family transcriptional regulator [Stappia stellulata]